MWLFIKISITSTDQIVHKSRDSEEYAICYETSGFWLIYYEAYYYYILNRWSPGSFKPRILPSQCSFSVCEWKCLQFRYSLILPNVSLPFNIKGRSRKQSLRQCLRGEKSLTLEVTISVTNPFWVTCGPLKVEFRVQCSLEEPHVEQIEQG